MDQDLNKRALRCTARGGGTGSFENGNDECLKLNVQAGATKAAPVISLSLVLNDADERPVADLGRLFFIVRVIDTTAGVEVRLLICNAGCDTIHRHFAGEVDLVSVECPIPILFAIQ